DYQSGRFGDAPDIYTEFTLQASSDGVHWQEIARTEPPRRDRPNAYFELASPVRARFIRYVHGHIGAANLAISDIRVFGNANGPPPKRPTRPFASRHQDQRDATIRWTKVSGAVGYNLRFGIRPDRLTLTHQIWADELGSGRLAFDGRTGAGAAGIEAVGEAVLPQNPRAVLVGQTLAGGDHKLGRARQRTEWGDRGNRPVVAALGLDQRPARGIAEELPR